MNGGGWLWLIIDVLGAAVLAAAMIYGVLQWRKHRSNRAERRAMDEKVRENYRRGG
ncbi:MAG TPA: hypothetical protein VNJ31_12525 [Methyloceanibacter sp.]|nr:hypothetical protein [Methyloceanibacter sp.]